jgi:hypothetical protein
VKNIFGAEYEKILYPPKKKKVIVLTKKKNEIFKNTL